MDSGSAGHTRLILQAGSNHRSANLSVFAGFVDQVSSGAELLLDKGYDVHGLIRRSSNFNTQRIDHLYQDPHESGARLQLHHADLTDAETGRSLATNDDDGVVDHRAVRRYLDADPLALYGFSGWVGPEPHGAALSNAGIRRDPLIADRVVAWLEDRYARRRAGDPAQLVADNTRIREVLGWRPQCDDLELICRTALDWEASRSRA